MSKRLRNEIGVVRSKAPTSSPDRDEMAAFVAALPKLDVVGLTLQAATHGDLERSILRRLNASRTRASETEPFTRREPATREGASLKPGALLVREWKGRLQHAMVLEEGFAWQGTTYGSLSQVAKAITGTNWNGHRFFGLSKSRDA